MSQCKDVSQGFLITPGGLALRTAIETHFADDFAMGGVGDEDGLMETPLGEAVVKALNQLAMASAAITMEQKIKRLREIKGAH